MSWTRAIPSDQLAEGDKREIEVNDTELLLVRHQGRVYATDARCPHMGAPLERAELTAEGNLVCPRHHSEFDIRTGQVNKWVPWPPVVGQVLGALKNERPLQVYETREEDGQVLVNLPE